MEDAEMLASQDDGVAVVTQPWSIGRRIAVAALAMLMLIAVAFQRSLPDSQVAVNTEEPQVVAVNDPIRVLLERQHDVQPH
ncbi:MAG: hypothetical protein HC788_15675 [Sphingopyxis sp.]|nr:hypothetical protein [Sphingopyxis sp.]